MRKAARENAADNATNSLRPINRMRGVEEGPRPMMYRIAAPAVDWQRHGNGLVAPLERQLDAQDDDMAGKVAEIPAAACHQQCLPFNL